ncbi:filament-like plant protein 7 [Dorcoceras hygrometricum]|uniref:Filament-like plant protein 7 n=1 Tax=Dorcoceras hygrometricum TaxID=472368 RepID=A0A2Z7BYM4_9LAMI|nr:filament-like plant protein 7 [Dorcoceras hygrometricum]
MDQKSWLWKKKSAEKTLLSDKANISLSRNEETTKVSYGKFSNMELLAEKAELERDLKILDSKLSSALSDCNANDNMAKKQMKIAQEAIAGWEKAESEVLSLKQELDNVLQQKAASEERLGHLDAALKQCMQQLRFVREEQEKRVHGAVAKTKEEFEKTRFLLDEKLSEAVKRMAILDAENYHLSKALSGKDKVIEDLSKYRTQVEADLNALMLRAESAEKENTSLKYEIRVLEKEHDIRNEEREFNRRTFEVTQKQLQESVKKIAKLESECQRLRLLVRKRLPGPAALAKMKNEVEMLGKDPSEIRRRRSNHSLISSENFHIDVPSATPRKRINSLTEQLHVIEEENRILKNALDKKSSELHFARTMFARTPSILSRAGQTDESFEDQTNAEPGHLCFFPEHSLAASSDMGSDDKVNCEESWTSALVSELQHLKNEKKPVATPSHRKMGNSDMNLMADFAEMEKLAVVSVDYPAGSSHHSSEAGNEIIGPSGSPSGRYSSTAPDMEMVPVSDFRSDSLISGQGIQSGNLQDNRVPGKLGDVLKMLLEHCHVSKRNPHEVVEDIRAFLSQKDSLNDRGGTNNYDTSNSQKVKGQVSLASPNKSLNRDATDTSNGNDVSVKRENGEIVQSEVSIAVHRILELLEGINAPSADNCVAESLSGMTDKLLSYKDTKTPTGYIVRVFQWKAAELTAILRRFGQTCNDLLNGTADLQQLIQLVASSLEWVMNHCFSVQDVSSMKDAICDHLGWDESRSESEIDNVSANTLAESNQIHTKREEMPIHRMLYPLSRHNHSRQTEAPKQNTNEECKRLNFESADKESSLVGLEAMPQSDTINFRIEPQEPKVIIENLLSEMETVEQSKGKTTDHFEKQNIIKEDLETRPMEFSPEKGKSRQNTSHSESELEKHNQCSRGPEETCHDIRTQSQSMTSKKVPVARKSWDNQLRTEREIAAASEKLAECQETILNLGKQVKALASPIDAVLFEKAVSAPFETFANVSTIRRTSSQRSSLLDKMQSEDNDQMDASPLTNDDARNVNNNSSVSITAVVEPWVKSNDLNPNDLHEGDKNMAASMAIVPIKKKEGKSILKKLFWLTKKRNGKKALYA